MRLSGPRDRYPEFEVVLFAEDVRIEAGGVPAVVRSLGERLAEQELAVRVACLYADKALTSVDVITIPPSGALARWGWSSRLRGEVRGLLRNGSSRRIVHIHGAWSALQYVAADEALRSQVPFVFTAHGMLEPWQWKGQGLAKYLKKSIYWRSFASRVLGKASLVHAVTSREKQNLRHLFPSVPTHVIPNATEVPEAAMPGEIRKRIVFLGRLNFGKGVDTLIRAFAEASLSAEWSLEIAGPVWSPAYYDMLQELAQRSGIASRVRFLGPVFGPAKDKLLRESWILALPSESEVMGMVNIEAAALGVPTVTSPQTGLSDWPASGGILVEPRPETLARVLRSVAGWDFEERIKRGESSRKFVEERYSWPVVLPRWMELYRSLLSPRTSDKGFSWLID